MSKRRLFSIACAATIGFASPSQAVEAAELVWKDSCPVAASPATRCGELIVPERRDDPNSRMITVPVAVISAPNQETKSPDPFLFLMGGTGSGFSVLSSAAQLTYALNRDVIVVEQRGNPMAKPSYTCPSVPSAVPMHRLYNSAIKHDGLNTVNACKADLAAKDLDIEAYTTPFAADDLIELRKQLGYESWNVYGVSYGGRVGTTLMRKDPEAIRSLIIDSAQFTGTWFSMFERLKAVGNFFDRCASAPQCGALYPNLRQTYEKTISKLSKRPIRIKYAGKRDTIGAYEYMHLVDWPLYNVGLDPMTRLPQAIEAAGRGDFNALLAINQIYGDYKPKWKPPIEGYSPDSRSNAQQVAMLCLEEFPFNKARDEGALAKAAGWSQPIVDVVADTDRRGREVCEQWGFGQDDPLQAQPPTGDRPTLILSAEHDTISPPAHSRAALKTLENAQLYVFPWTAHGVIYERMPCTLGVMRQFIENPVGKLDTSCIAAISEPSWVPPSAGLDRDNAIGVMHALIANSVEKFNLPGRAVHMDAPKIGVEGLVHVDGRPTLSAAPVTGREPFRIASQTKTYTGAAILRLMELGKLKVDDPIEGYLSDASLASLKAGGYDAAAITIAHLIQHTAGMPDYAMDRAYMGEIAANPARQWTRQEQIEWGLVKMKKRSEPGERYHYSDTGYVLAGEIIERLTGKPQAQAYRELLKFEQLGLTKTWFETLEPAPEGVAARANQYAQGQNVRDVNPSFDLYGGGGLVSTHEELTAFYRALFEGDVFDNSGTLDVLLTVPETNDRGESGYGFGIRYAVIDGVRCWGHGGFFGTSTYHCPDFGMTVTSNRYTADTPPAYDGLSVLRTAIMMHRVRIKPAHK